MALTCSQCGSPAYNSRDQTDPPTCSACRGFPRTVVRLGPCAREGCPGKTRKGGKYCSVACVRAARNAQGAKEREEARIRTCGREGCGRSFQVKRRTSGAGRRSGGGYKYCSPECAELVINEMSKTAARDRHGGSWRRLERRRQDLLAAQEGKCDLCGEEVSREDWSLDHDHRCCDVRARLARGDCDRGVLHLRCNGMAGFADDSAGKLALGIEYLFRHGAAGAAELEGIARRLLSVASSTL